MMLSKRMQAVADLVPEAACLADIGTDHGYLPISLVQKGRVSRAIAMDVNAGPLDRASGHIEECGLGERIATRLSDGLTELGPGEADVVLIAGMGGPLTVRILERGKNIWNPAAGTEPGGGSKAAGSELDRGSGGAGTELDGGSGATGSEPGGGSKAVGSEPDGGSKAAGTEPGNGSRNKEEQDPVLTVKAIILQPQSEIRDFRIFLRENGYRILRNKVVLSEGKYYFPILAAPGLEEALPPEEQELADRFGLDLLVPGSPLLPYLEYERAKLLSILDSLGNLSEDRLTDLKTDLSMIESALHIINS